jgi:hypothetical protein
MARQLGAFVYGRRMYETMTGWQNIDDDTSAPDYIVEFARIWREKPKIIFSTTLKAVGPNCRLVAGDVADLRLLETRTFGCGAVYLRYQRVAP